MSTATTRVALRPAARLADKIAAVLSSACDRIEVAGSIRRDEPEVGDIEIVAIPATMPGGLFGQTSVSRLDPILRDLVAEGRLARGLADGERYKQFQIPAAGGLRLDLFLVTFETWGVQLAIRTGPADFSRELVTERCRGGRLQDGLTIGRGRVWRTDQVARGMVDYSDGTGGSLFLPMDGAQPLDTPEEADFLALAGGWIEPAERHVGAAIRETA